MIKLTGTNENKICRRIWWNLSAKHLKLTDKNKWECIKVYEMVESTWVWHTLEVHECAFVSYKHESSCKCNSHS